MRRTTTKKIVSVAVFAIVGTVFPSFVADTWAQRTTRPTDGTECLVVTGSVPDGAPRVFGSREPMQEAYGEGDELFVGGPGVANLTVGQRLQFVRPYGEVRHPQTNDVVAEAVGWLGFAEVLVVGSDRAIVRVTKSCREIEAGEVLLEPDIRTLPQVEDFPDFEPVRLVTANDDDAVIILGDLESVISESGESRTGTAARYVYGQRDVVVIDQGSADGWSVGDIVDLYRDESALRTESGATTWTPLLLGIGMIVSVDDGAAAVLIVEGDLSVQIGDRVRRSISAGS